MLSSNIYGSNWHTVTGGLKILARVLIDNILARYIEELARHFIE